MLKFETGLTYRKRCRNEFSIKKRQLLAVVFYVIQILSLQIYLVKIYKIKSVELFALFKTFNNTEYRN